MNATAAQSRERKTALRNAVAKALASAFKAHQWAFAPLLSSATETGGQP